jgi:hypothetical protein
MNQWQATAWLPPDGEAIMVFGVQADIEHEANIKARQILAPFPLWSVEVTEIKPPDDR